VPGPAGGLLPGAAREIPSGPLAGLRPARRRPARRTSARRRSARRRRGEDEAAAD